MKAISFRPAITKLTVSSITTAALACALPWLVYVAPFIGLGGVFALLMIPPVLWATITATALIVHKSRALWLLLGAPLALIDSFLPVFNPCDPTGKWCL